MGRTFKNMGAAKSKAATVATREAKNWVSCSAATTCNIGWGCCNSFTISSTAGLPTSTDTAAGSILRICVNPGIATGQVPSNVKTYGGRFFYCSLPEAKLISNGAGSLTVASAVAVTAAYLAI